MQSKGVRKRVELWKEERRILVRNFLTEKPQCAHAHAQSYSVGTMVMTRSTSRKFCQLFYHRLLQKLYTLVVAVRLDEKPQTFPFVTATQSIWPNEFSFLWKCIES